ncbi:ABC-2 transporter permease [Sphaerisporangium aureirubrum]|uniref:ABC transporter permease n=1 Tax=Sphaerisporangium aureirubrum TaxID=1544736 RepID=A0ABW1NRT6_9ACTN
MIWLTWRQFRASAATVAGALVVLVVLLGLTGPELASDHSSWLAACAADPGACPGFAKRLLDDYEGPYLMVGAAVVLLPVLIGLFWGAPLVSRELEAGTHRLVWGQSITRTRWLTVKLAVTVPAAMAAAAVGGLAATWWAAPFDETAGGDFSRMAPLMFPARGIVPIGYAAFALVLGVAAGMVLRRTVAAMAVTLAIFTAVQLAMPLLARPHLLPPVRATVEITRGNLESLGGSRDGPPIRVTTQPPEPGAWVLSSTTVDASGRPVATIPLSMSSGPCTRRGGDVQPCLAEIKRLGYRQQTTYHPSSRYWPLQGLETGIYLALALGLAWFSLRRIRHLP